MRYKWNINEIYQRRNVQCQTFRRLVNVRAELARNCFLINEITWINQRILMDELDGRSLSWRRLGRSSSSKCEWHLIVSLSIQPRRATFHNSLETVYWMAGSAFTVERRGGVSGNRVHSGVTGNLNVFTLVKWKLTAFDLWRGTPVLDL